MISSFNNFYNNLSSDGIFFFWIIAFLFIFLIILTIILISKNKKLIKIIREEEQKENNSYIINDSEKEENNIHKEEKIEIKEEPKIEKEEEIAPPVIDNPKTNIKEEPKENGLYQKNILREMSSREQTSPIHIEKKEEYIKKENLDNFDFNKNNYDNGLGMIIEDPNISVLEQMEDHYELNDNMKFASNIVEKMEEEIKPSNIELTEFEKKQEEEAIISYDELLKVKDKIYNITEDEDTDEFIDQLKNFRLDLQ